MAPQPKHFDAALEKGHHALGWTIAHLPFDPRKEWKEMIKLRVAGEINSFPFRTSLFAEHALSGDTGFYLLLPARHSRHAEGRRGNSQPTRTFRPLA